MRGLAKGHGPAASGKFSYSQLVDLSWSVFPGIPQWPGDPAVETEVAATIERNGYYLRRFTMGEHSGTHLTAPSSFYIDGAGPEDYRPDQLVVPAVVLNVSGQCEYNPDFSFTQDDLQAWEAEHGQVPDGSLALLYTGWPARWRQPAEYLGRDAEGATHLPRLSCDEAFKGVKARLGKMKAIHVRSTFVVAR